MDIEKFLHGFFSEIDVPTFAYLPIRLLTGEIAKGRTVYGRKRINGDWEYYNFPQLKGTMNDPEAVRDIPERQKQ